MDINIADQVKEIKDSMVEALGLENIKAEIEKEIFLNRTVERFWIPLAMLTVWLMHYPSTHYRKDDTFLVGKMIYPEQEIVKAKKAERQINSTSSRIDYLEKEIKQLAMIK